jgi:oxygen-independent coproporphyrinogen-3 oxidase
LAGIYIHIPFCKQACNYCNFHFTTSLRGKNELVTALLSEINLRKDYLNNEPVESIYFGGGTPSLLEIEDIRLMSEEILSIYNVTPTAEITIETNPDDTSYEKLKGWKEVGVNRLSIGIQSFFDEDLKWMNRAHTAREAIDTLLLAIKYFDNITIDLIYGLPLMTNENWRQNVERAISFNIPHLSFYALTVEPKTLLHKMIAEQKIAGPDPDKQSEQFLLLMHWMENAGYEHYEISNFARPGFRSQHNSSYWQGKKYIGIGPSSHSFDGESRQWNVSNNYNYINSINAGIIPCERELLTVTQQLNEYIMTSLRTIEGLDLDQLGNARGYELCVMSKKFIERGLMTEEQNHLTLTKEGKLFADGIAAELFFSEKYFTK